VNASASATIDFDIAAINDEPTAGDFTVTVAKNSTSAPFNLQGADVDAGGNNTTDAALSASGVAYRVVIAPASGTLRDSSNNVLTDGSPLTVAQATGMTFEPVNNFSGDLSFTYVAIDTAGEETATPATVALSVTAVNIAPAVTVPVDPQSAIEDTPLSINGISIADVDAGTGLLEVTVSAGNGTVELATVANLFSDDGGTTSLGATAATSITFYGQLADINNALDGLAYQGNQDFNGADIVTVAVNDRGFTAGAGAGTPQSDSDKIDINVAAADDAPTTPALTLASITEDQDPIDGASLASLFAGAGFSADVDGDGLDGVAVSASPDNTGAGEWQYSLNAGATWNAIGSVSQNAALLLPATAFVRFQPDANYGGTPAVLTVHAIDDSGSRTFTTNPSSEQTVDVTVSADDLDATGATLSTSVNSQNDILVVANDESLRVDEGTNQVLTTATLQVTDVEADASQIVYTLKAAGSTLGDGVFQHDSTGSGGWVDLAFDDAFTQQDIDDGHIRYSHDGAEPLGTEVLAYEVTDLVGGEGTTLSRTLDIAISPINDIPVLTQSVVTDVPILGSKTFEQLVVDDPDNTDAQLTFQLDSLPDPAVGRLTIAGRPVTVGSLFRYDQLDEVVFTSVAADRGTTTIDYTLRDGAGGVVVAAAGITIGVGAANTAPDGFGNLTAPAISEDIGSYDTTNFPGFDDTNEGNTLAGYGAAFSDPDGGGSVVGVAVVGSATSSAGDWQFSTDGGTTWRDIGTVNDGAAALVLPVDARLRFDPANNYYGPPPSLQLRAIDDSFLDAVNAAIYPGTYSDSAADTRVLVDTSRNDDGYAVSGTVNTLGITVTPVNDDPVINRNNQLRVASGGAGTVSSTLLEINDVDTADDEITYTLTAVPGVGELRLDEGGTPRVLMVGDTFTQADINSGDLGFSDSANSPDGTTTSFSFTVKDGDTHDVYGRDGGIYDDPGAEPKATLETITFSILIETVEPPTFLAINDARTMDWNTAAAPNTLSLTEADLLANDTGTNRDVAALAGLADSGTITTANNGTVVWDNSTGAFTYTPDLDFVGTDTISYQMTSDEGTAVATLTVTVRSVDVPPTVDVNQPLTGDEGATVGLTSALLESSDANEYDGPSNLVYTITALDGDFASTGVLYSSVQVGNPAADKGVLSVNDTFTQADINAGLIEFRHNGSEEFTTGFTFSLTDGTHVVSGQRFDIDITPINDAPVFTGTNSQQLVAEGGFLDLTSLISVSDADGGGDKDPAEHWHRKMVSSSRSPDSPVPGKSGSMTMPVLPPLPRSVRATR
jgi:hypothetical protein